MLRPALKISMRDQVRIDRLQQRAPDDGERGVRDHAARRLERRRAVRAAKHVDR